MLNLRRKDLKFIADNKNKNEAKFKFQGLSVRSQHWFYLDFYSTEVNFSTHDPNFYKKLFQIHDNTQDSSSNRKCKMYGNVYVSQ